MFSVRAGTATFTHPARGQSGFKYMCERRGGLLEPDEAAVGGFPASDSSLSGICIISLCWILKSLITVFCQKLKANQGGGKSHSTCPSLSRVRPLESSRLYSDDVCLRQRAVALKARRDALVDSNTAALECDLHKGRRCVGKRILYQSCQQQSLFALWRRTPCIY